MTPTIKLQIKPMSVNEAYTGKRFATQKYRDYRKALMLMLVNIKLPEPPLEVYYEFGFSNVNADWDGPIKPFQDILQKRYNFNDKLIRRAVVETDIVPKGKEFIRFSIKHYQKD